MNVRKWLLWLCCIVVSLSAMAYGEALHVEFGEQGLKAIRFEGQNVLGDGAIKVTRVVTTPEFRDRHTEPLGPHPSPTTAGEARTFADASVEVRYHRAFDQVALSEWLTYDWGTVSVQYKPGPDRLDLHVRVQNTSLDVIELVQMQLLELALPGEIEPQLLSTVAGRGRSNRNIEGPDLRRAQFEGGQLLWLSLQPNRPMQQLIQVAGGGGVRLSASAGHETGGVAVYDGTWDSRPIKPGEGDSYELSLRFAAHDANAWDEAADVFRAFGEAYPPVFDWPDRRPIGTLHIGDSRRNRRNPRGWFALTHDANFPGATDENYQERFREHMLANADQVIGVSRRLGLQGVIVWQIEGMQEVGHSYYGEPRILPYAAPEMDAVADEYFAKLRNAGLRVGVTLRPVIQIPFDPEEGDHSGPIRGVVGFDKLREAAIRADWSVQFRNVYWQSELPEVLLDVYDPEEAWCVVTRLVNKIGYAKERWGATLFYLDANMFTRPHDRSVEGWNWRRLQISADQIKQVQERHPDVLIISEWQSLEYWSTGAQYTQPPSHGWESGPDVRAAYPDAMTAIAMVSNDPFDNHPDRLARGVAKGDVLMPASWYGGHIRFIDRIYGTAALEAPFAVMVGDASIRVNGREMADPAALREYLSQQLAAAALLRDRRVYVGYDEAVDYTARVVPVLDAVLEAGGSIAWSQSRSIEAVRQSLE